MRVAALIATALRSLPRSGAILCGHGIASQGEPSSHIHITETELERVVELARRLGQLVSLREIIERRACGKSNKGLVALTFDDACVTLNRVRSYLECNSVPVTVFVVSDAAKRGGGFWWDRLELVMRRCSREQRETLADELDLPSPAAESFDIARDILLRRGRGRTTPQMEASIGRLEDATGLSTTQYSMTYHQLVEWYDSELFDLASHTRTHPVLPLLPSDEVLHEIQQGYRELVDNLGPGILPSLAVPFGLYDERTTRLAREAGISSTFSLAKLSLDHVPETGELPRITISRGQEPWKLVLKMSGLADGVRIRRGALKIPNLPQKTS